MKCPFKKIKIIKKGLEGVQLKEIIDFSECDATDCMAYLVDQKKCIKLLNEAVVK